MIKRFKIISSLLLIQFLVVSSSFGEEKKVKDCFEKINRATFAFNMALDKVLFRPVATGYRKLPSPIKWQEFLDNVKDALSASHIKHTKPVSEKVQTIAVCGGSGSFLLIDAISKRADVFVTSDFKYHEFFDADGKIMIADVGHYESEWRTSSIIANRIKKKFTNFAVRLASANTNPVQFR